MLVISLKILNVIKPKQSIKGSKYITGLMMEQKRSESAERMMAEDSKGGRRSLGGGTVGLSFSSFVWILVLLLGTGAQLAYPGLRNLPPSGVPGRQSWELRSRIQTAQRGSAPKQEGRSRA